MRLTTFGKLLASACVALCMLVVVAPANATLILTGAFDGPLPGGLPKGVEIYVAADIADLSQYGVGSASNGGGTDGQEFALSGSASAGDFLYVATDTTNFQSFFGFAPDFVDTFGVNINGDDAVELFFQGNVIDTFGNITYPSGQGAAEPWNHLDGWGYRNDGTGPDGGTFVLANWSFSGINQLEGGTTNGTTTSPFPIGTYIAVPEPASLALVGLASLVGVGLIRRRS